MTGRERLAAAFSPTGSPETPAVICYEGIFIRDHWEQLTQHPWWFNNSAELEHQLAWRRDVIERVSQDWFFLPVCPPREQRERTRIVTRGPDVFLVDDASGRETQLERPRIGGWTVEGQAQSVHPDSLPQSAEQVAAQIPAPPDAPPDAITTDGRSDLATALLEEFGTQLCPVRHISSPLWQTYSRWGFEGMMQMLALQPELVELACERYLALDMHSVEESAALGAEVIWIEECLTDMISPTMFARLNLPYLRRLTDAIRAAGMKSIYYYCGDPSTRWEHLLASGADALALEEGKKGFAIEIEEIVDHAAGEVTVLGNLDAMHVLRNAPEPELRQEIARQLTAGRRNGRRFIMSIGSPVTPETTADRVRRYCELVRELDAGAAES